MGEGKVFEFDLLCSRTSEIDDNIDLKRHLSEGSMGQRDHMMRNSWKATRVDWNDSMMHRALRCANKLYRRKHEIQRENCVGWQMLCKNGPSVDS